jgi:hypothetical protein
MFLQIVSNTGDIGGYFGTMGKAHTGHFPQGRIRLFGGNRHYPGTHPPLLGAGLKRRGLRFRGNLLPPKTNQLINSRHEQKTPKNQDYTSLLTAKTLWKTYYIKKKKKDQVPPDYFDKNFHTRSLFQPPEKIF